MLNMLTGGTTDKGYAFLCSEISEKEEDEAEATDEQTNELCGKKVDIPTDAYGAAILCFARDIPLLSDSRDPDQFELALWSVFYSMLVLIVNLLLQSSILAYVYRYVVAGDIAKVQRSFKNFRLNVFDHEGVFQDYLWDDYDGKDELCQIAMWNRPFYYCVLFCWLMVMLIEIKKSEELILNLYEVPLCSEPSAQLHCNDEDRYVVAFTRWTRNSLLALVALPKLGISIVLMWLGCEWLSATIEFEALVMNSVAMNFIVSIDEILFESILPNHHRADVENIDFLVKKAEGEDEESAEAVGMRKAAFRKALMYIVFTLIFIVLYAEYMQDVLPPAITEVAGKCQEVVAQQTPKCSGWTWYLQGNPSALNCFPFPGEPPELP